MRRSSRLWLGVLIVALAAGLATAQTFTESTQVVVVEVPVQVVRDGEPVRGLTAADFEVFDGRKKVPITGFEVLDLTTATAAPQAGQEPLPITARRHFLVLFDLSFSDPKAISQARKAAMDMVKVLHPTDLVAVATYSNKGPQIALGFTADRRQIAAAVETLGLPEMMDRNPDPLRLLVTDAESALSHPTGGASTQSEARQAVLEAALENMEKLEQESSRADASEEKARIAAFTTSISALARMMDAVDGRKYVVYLSEGFDTSLVQGSQDQETLSEQSESAASGEIWNVDSETRFGDTKSLNQIEKMLEEFRRANCTVQAVDIGGLRPAGAVEGNQARGARGGKDSLLQIARGTGGELFENTNNLAGAMQDVLKRTSVTYVLAFQPDSLKWDGNYHRLKVEVKGQPRGTRLVHRPGYYAPKPYTARGREERILDAASQLVSGEESGTVKMAVLAAPFKVSGDKAYVPVLLEVDGPSLLANTTGSALPAEVYIYAMDSGGAVHDFVAQTLGLDIAKAGAQLRQSGLKFFGHVDLYPGDYSIRVMVRNGATGASSLRVVPVRVPAFAEAGPFLLPAFFPEPGGKWLMAREAPREGQPQNVPYPFMQGEQPYIPASRPVLTPGQEAPLSLVAYNLGSGDIKAQAKVLSLDGKDLGAGDLKLLGSESGSPTRLKASFRPPALQPGEYRLQVTLVDPSGATHSSTTAFVVGGGGKATR